MIPPGTLGSKNTVAPYSVNILSIMEPFIVLNRLSLNILQKSSNNLNTLSLSIILYVFLVTKSVTIYGVGSYVLGIVFVSGFKIKLFFIIAFLTISILEPLSMFLFIFKKLDINTSPFLFNMGLSLHINSSLNFFTSKLLTPYSQYNKFLPFIGYCSCILNLGPLIIRNSV